MSVEVRLRGQLPSPSAAHDAGLLLGTRLRDHRGAPSCQVTVTANRQRVLAWRLSPELELSVHWSLAPHVEDILALVDGDQAAWDRLRRALPTPPPRAAAPTRPQGQVHDLAALLEGQRALLQRAPSVRVGWGRWSSVAPRRVLRLGSCSTGPDPEIRIHPVLDHRDVPDWFVGFILFHELLHAVFPPLQGAGRRVVHPKSFRAAERRHPDHARALVWERENLGELMRRCALRAKAR